MRTFVASAVIAMFIMFFCTAAWSAGPTQTSRAAQRLEQGMQLGTVLSILGEPNWAIIKSDSGKFSLNQPPDTPEDMKITFELLWKNKNCAPVSVSFTKYYKVVGWDRGLECGPDVEKELPEKYSCDQHDRTRYCKQ